MGREQLIDHTEAVWPPPRTSTNTATAACAMRPDEIEAIDRIAAVYDVSRSELIRRILRSSLAYDPTNPSPEQTIKDLFMGMKPEARMRLLDEVWAESWEAANA